MKSTLFLITGVFILTLGSCREDDTGSSCNDLLSACGKTLNVPYCTFGYRWGSNNPFSPAGPEVPGPRIPTLTISFKFQNAGMMFTTHSETNVESLTFSEDDKEAIREAISEWSAVADISFVEKFGDEKTNITIIRADIEQGGLGYPAFPDEPCRSMAGYLIIGIRSTKPDLLVIHEMGHVLGLGHVASDNIMNPDKVEDLGHIQAGDIEGIQSIYGSK